MILRKITTLNAVAYDTIVIEKLAASSIETSSILAMPITVLPMGTIGLEIDTIKLTVPVPYPKRVYTQKTWLVQLLFSEKLYWVLKRDTKVI